MLEDLLFELHEKASELLDYASGLKDAVQNAPQLPSDEIVARVETLLKQSCLALRRVVEIVQHKTDSPLSELTKRIDGTLLSRDQSDLKLFLTTHEKLIRHLGVSTEAVDRAMALLRGELESGESRLDRPETLNPEAIIEALETLRDFVCELSAQASLFKKVWPRDLLLECANGVIGGCLIIVDITGALTAPHVTAFVFFKAVKSTWSGYRLVKKAVARGKDLWQSWKAAVGQENVKLKGKGAGKLK